jgi:hypothetical protein
MVKKKSRAWTIKGVGEETLNDARLQFKIGGAVMILAGTRFELKFKFLGPLRGSSFEAKGGKGLGAPSSTFR